MQKPHDPSFCFHCFHKALFQYFSQEKPYDNTVMPVKRIDAFRIGSLGRRAALFDPYKPMRHWPKSLPARLQGAGRKNLFSPFGNQAEIIQEGPATIPEKYARVQIREMPTGRSEYCGEFWNRIMNHVSKHRGRVIHGIRSPGWDMVEPKAQGGVFRAGCDPGIKALFVNTIFKSCTLKRL